jgi:hypothetical protein
MELFNVQNITDGNGIAISIGGMAIVFGGLLIISIYITLLPRILKLLSVKDPEDGKAALENLELKYNQEKKIDENKDIASVIGLVLQMEQERLVQSSNQIITIFRDDHSLHWSKISKLRIKSERRKNA